MVSPEELIAQAVLDATEKTWGGEILKLTDIEQLHADRIDRIERYVNSEFGGECDMRTLIILVIKDFSNYPNKK